VLQLNFVFNNVCVMKNLFTFFIALSFCFSATAQKTSDKAVFKTPMPNCEQCRDLLQLLLSKSEGVTSVKVNAKAQTTTVTWLTERTDKETVKVYISSIGFAADDVEADEFAVKRLPACCKPQPVASPVVKPAPTPATQPVTPKPASDSAKTVAKPVPTVGAKPANSAKPSAPKAKKVPAKKG
jgi:periplasmic mercuric ion binding protein